MDGSALETGHIVEPEDFGPHIEAVRYWLQHREVSIDFERWRRGLEEVGEDGLVPVYLASTPLKQLHWIARQDGASLAIYDYPDEMRELMRIHEEQVLAHTENVVDMDEAWLFVIRDNVDFMFYPPPWLEEYLPADGQEDRRHRPLPGQVRLLARLRPAEGAWLPSSPSRGWTPWKARPRRPSATGSSSTRWR